MSTAKRRVFNREVKLSAVRRLMAGESGAKIAQELQVGPNYLSKWWANYRRYGAEGLRPAHRPRKADAAKLNPTAVAAELTAADRRVRELERKIGQQQLELDFFQKALRQVGKARRPSDGPGLQTSTPRSRQ
jgi:transposase-like protein